MAFCGFSGSVEAKPANEACRPRYAASILMIIASPPRFCRAFLPDSCDLMTHVRMRMCCVLVTFARSNLSTTEPKRLPRHDVCLCITGNLGRENMLSGGSSSGLLSAGETWVPSPMADGVQPKKKR